MDGLKKRKKKYVIGGSSHGQEEIRPGFVLYRTSAPDKITAKHKRQVHMGAVFRVAGIDHTTFRCDRLPKHSCRCCSIANRLPYSHSHWFWWRRNWHTCLLTYFPVAMCIVGCRQGFASNVSILITQLKILSLHFYFLVFYVRNCKCCLD